MPHKRLYISADIEGIAGVVSAEHTTPAVSAVETTSRHSNTDLALSPPLY